jgi:hypothetical protein
VFAPLLAASASVTAVCCYHLSYLQAVAPQGFDIIQHAVCRRPHKANKYLQYYYLWLKAQVYKRTFRSVIQIYGMGNYVKLKIRIN